MFKLVAVVFTAVVLASCASLDFYGPEVGKDWSSSPVKTVKGAITAQGVTVKKIGEEYSPVLSVGNLLNPAYQGGRKETWSVDGPAGHLATVDLIQSDLVFSGPVTDNVLKADTIDFTKARQAVSVTSSGPTVMSQPGSVTSPPSFKVIDFEVIPTYQGVSGKKVADYKNWGLTTGLRLTKGSTLTGYLSLTNGTALLLGPGVDADPLLIGLALISAQSHFEGRTPTQKVVPEIIDVFGLKLTTSVTHN